MMFIVEEVGVIFIFFGLVNIEFVNVFIFGGMVVEKNKVCFWVGSSFRMCLMLWINFMFSIWFVLFNIKKLSEFREINFCDIKFNNLLGVVISI